MSELKSSEDIKDVKDEKLPISLDVDDGSEMKMPKIDRFTVNLCGEELVFPMDDNTWPILRRIEYFTLRMELGITHASILEMDKGEFQTFIKLLIKHPFLSSDLVLNKDTAAMFKNVNLVKFIDKYAVDTSKILKYNNDVKVIDVKAIVKELFLKGMDRALHVGHSFHYCDKKDGILLSKTTFVLRVSVIKPKSVKDIPENVQIKKCLQDFKAHFNGQIDVLWRGPNIVFFIKAQEVSYDIFEDVINQLINKALTF
jgi:hypothetical protein